MRIPVVGEATMKLLHSDVATLGYTAQSSGETTAPSSGETTGVIQIYIAWDPEILLLNIS